MKFVIGTTAVKQPGEACARQAPVATPSKAARYISLRVGSWAKRSAMPSAEIITVTGRWFG
jgi:hypothetical protein